MEARTTVTTSGGSAPRATTGGRRSTAPAGAAAATSPDAATLARHQLRLKAALRRAERHARRRRFAWAFLGFVVTIILVRLLDWWLE